MIFSFKLTNGIIGILAVLLSKNNKDVQGAFITLRINPNICTHIHTRAYTHVITTMYKNMNINSDCDKHSSVDRHIIFLKHA